MDAQQLITNRGSSDSRSVSKEKLQLLAPQQPTGAESLDELLEYINGGRAQQQSDQQPQPSTTALSGGAKSSSKAAKRQRQKQRKEEERARIKQQQQQQHQRTDSNAADDEEVKDSIDLNETDLEVEQFKRYATHRMHRADQRTAASTFKIGLTATRGDQKFRGPTPFCYSFNSDYLHAYSLVS